MPSILLLILLTSMNVFADQEAESFLEVGDRAFNQRDNHFFFGISWEELPFEPDLEFEGDLATVNDRITYLNGIGLELGYELNLGEMLTIMLKAQGFHAENFTQDTKKASEDYPVDVQSIDHLNRVQAYGGAIAIGLEWMSRWKIGIEPFLEFGTGTGTAFLYRDYEYNSTNNRLGEEYYLVDLTYDFTYTRTALGVNFKGSYGLFSFFKVTQMAITPGSGEIELRSKLASGGRVAPGKQDIDDLDAHVAQNMITIGAGYMF